MTISPAFSVSVRGLGLGCFLRFFRNPTRKPLSPRKNIIALTFWGLVFWTFTFSAPHPFLKRPVACSSCLSLLYRSSLLYLLQRDPGFFGLRPCVGASVFSRLSCILSALLFIAVCDYHHSFTVLTELFRSPPVCLGLDFF